VTAMEVVEKRIFFSCADAGAELRAKIDSTRAAVDMCMRASIPFTFVFRGALPRASAEPSKAADLGQCI